MARATIAILLLGCCTCAVWSVNDRLREVFSWRQLDFVFPDQKTRQAAIASGEYVQANNLPLGLEVWRDKLFITVPRWKAGVASTLNYVSLGSDSDRNRSPPLVPYPNYATNRLPANNQQAAGRIVNTFRMAVDACNRLWLVDMNAANGTEYGDPKLMVFDLNTDRKVRQYTIGASLRRSDGSTWFPGLTVDVDANQCDRAHAYLPDIGWGMVVYRWRDDVAWRVEHPYFFFDPMATVFNMGGVRTEWQDGVFGVALSRRRANGRRTLYFHALASTRMFGVDTSVLQSNGTAAATYDEYRHLGYRPSGMQAATMAMDPVTGTLFYALVNQDAIGCWNPDRWDGRHSTNTSAVVARDPVALNFPSDVKVDANSNLWVLSDRMPRFRFRVAEFDVTDVNYRVLSAPVVRMIKGTVCDNNDS
ncbi:protein yellow isoform X1 [Sipha flava]|uniref:Protein yellow n=1 Tax=Sipha flava TaxID=143950 RepID=A0A2S2Q342_9HEMI|nr:protein yellow isoform X1 [Sipha flava]